MKSPYKSTYSQTCATAPNHLIVFNLHYNKEQNIHRVFFDSTVEAHRYSAVGVWRLKYKKCDKN